jgi:hypothetical protein
MTKASVLATFAICISLVGCASAQYRSPVPDGAARTFDGATSSEADIEARLAETLEFCLPILSGYEAKAYHRARKAFYLRMFGLAIGSVAVPALAAANAAANAAWIAAGSGFGGSASFAASAYEASGLSGTAPAEVRNAIVSDLKTEIATASDGTLPIKERRGALLRARSACVVYGITVPTLPGGP